MFPTATLFQTVIATKFTQVKAQIKIDRFFKWDLHTPDAVRPLRITYLMYSIAYVICTPIMAPYSLPVCCDACYTV